MWSRGFALISGFLVRPALAVDAAGNVLIAGGFRGTVNFGGGSLTSADIFVARLQSFGGEVWSRSIGDASFQMPSAVATDGAGNVVVAGGFGGTIDSGNGPLTATNTDIFVTKLTP